jgi:D-ribose pyranase
MIRNGILNPEINALISRVRHTNTLVIADRGFPYWAEIEIVDISLVDDLPRVLDVLRAIEERCVIGRIFMAEEFRQENESSTQAAFKEATNGMKIVYEPHEDFKQRVPGAVGLIRTGDTTQYANMIIESA